ncbi:MAG TPA: cytochrome c, partial [Planctomycetota bacterium]|nr:cytochrome c [Planctomycetota bacterium]
MKSAPLALWLALAGGLAAAARSPARRQEAAPPEPLPLAAGLAVTFRSASGTDARVARLAALYVPAGRSPTPFLAPGPFEALFEGFVTVDLGTDCSFSAAGRGTLEVRVNGALTLEARGDDFSKVQGTSVFLKKGRNRLLVRYSSPAEGDAFFRLSWSSQDFPREPVGPPAVFHDPATPALARPNLLRRGLEVLTSRRCLQCHPAFEDGGKAKIAGWLVPELAGPSLKDVGARLRPEWMARWIHNPRAFRADASMPRFADLDAQEAADLAAFLATLGTPPPEGPAPAPEAVAEGGRLFAQLRCVGCHTRPDREPDSSRVPLSHLAAKWRPEALREFLKAPARHYPWIGMPDFGLTETEASALAAFLRARSQSGGPSGPEGDA